MERFILTADHLYLLLNYDPKTGVFTNLVRRGPRCPIGSVAGCYTAAGYVEIMIYGYHHKASRLAWLYMTGEWPKDQVDHINHIRDDNRWVNLRDVTSAENCANRLGRFATK